jgi:hypothetical protein
VVLPQKHSGDCWQLPRASKSQGAITKRATLSIGQGERDILAGIASVSSIENVTDSLNPK